MWMIFDVDDGKKNMKLGWKEKKVNVRGEGEMINKKILKDFLFEIKKILRKKSFFFPPIAISFFFYSNNTGINNVSSLR